MEKTEQCHDEEIALEADAEVRLGIQQDPFLEPDGKKQEPRVDH